MKKIFITEIISEDVRFPLDNGAGSDAVHTIPQYAYAVCKIKTDSNLEGIGLTFTLGLGNDLVCRAIEYLSETLKGRELNELMSNFGEISREISDSPCYRWLGPHKGLIHLALSSIVNACFDLWAKSKNLPLWKLLIELSPNEIVNLLDFRYIEDVLTKEEALEILNTNLITKNERMNILDIGYTGYDTSVGWFNYSDEKIVANAKEAVKKGFKAMKLKVGSKNPKDDIRRALLIRETVGNDITIMLDANQQWTLKDAISIINEIKTMNPFWIEEPTDPDDVIAHRTLAHAVSPIKLALGEHVSNKVMFKNFLLEGAMEFNQVDALRVAGVSEFILISLMSKKFNVPVIPHVGDMGQLHQHLVLFNHIYINHPALFLEYIPHLSKYFKYPAIVENGKYKTPYNIGASMDLV